MNSNTPNIILFTCDIVLSEIIKKLLEKCFSEVKFKVFDSFSEANELSKNDDIDLVLIDDLIIGTSSYELISFLRENIKIKCPIIYFGVKEHDSERKAILIGANYFINKPFNPEQAIELFKSNIDKTNNA